MKKAAKIGISCILALLMVAAATAALAQSTVLTGTLEENGTFNRPSTNSEPTNCYLSGDYVYYEPAYSYVHPGGRINIRISDTTAFSAVVVGYTSGGFNPGDPCVNFMGAGGCGDPYTQYEYTSDEPMPAGTYDLVVTSCDEGETGYYEITLTSIPETVPTLGVWGAIAGVLVLSGTGIAVIRRRRKTRP